MTRLELTECVLAEWHRLNYPGGVNVPATYRKLCEEIGELGEALMAGDEHAKHEEAADVAIVLLHLIRGITGQNYALLGLIERKLDRPDLYREISEGRKAKEV